MINKHKYRVCDNKKILHKIGKRWITISALTLAMLGGSMAISTVATHADTDNIQSNAKAVANAPTVKLNASASLEDHTNGIQSQASAMHKGLVATAIKSNISASESGSANTNAVSVKVASASSQSQINRSANSSENNTTSSSASQISQSQSSAQSSSASVERTSNISSSAQSDQKSNSSASNQSNENNGAEFKAEVARVHALYAKYGQQKGLNKLAGNKSNSDNTNLSDMYFTGPTTSGYTSDDEWGQYHQYSDDGLSYIKYTDTGAIEFTGSTIRDDGRPDTTTLDHFSYKNINHGLERTNSDVDNAPAIKFDGNVNVQGVKNMSGMFREYGTSDHPLVYVDLGNNFDTRSVSDMSNMFEHDWNLQAVKLGNKFVAKNGTKINNMFADDPSLKSIDFGNNIHNSDNNDIFANNGQTMTIGTNGKTSQFTTFYNIPLDASFSHNDKIPVTYQLISDGNGGYQEDDSGKYYTQAIPINLMDGQSHPGSYTIHPNPMPDTIIYTYNGQQVGSSQKLISNEQANYTFSDVNVPQDIVPTGYTVASDQSTSFPLDGQTHYIQLQQMVEDTVQFHDIYSDIDGMGSQVPSSFTKQGQLNSSQNVTLNGSDGTHWTLVDNNDQPIKSNGIVLTGINHVLPVAPVYDGMTYKYDQNNNSVEFTGGTPNSDLSHFSSGSPMIQNAKSITFDDDIVTDGYENIADMFTNDTNLQKISFGKDFNTVSSSDTNAFTGDTNLNSITIKSSNTSFDSVSGLKSKYYSSNGTDNQSADLTDNKAHIGTWQPTPSIQSDIITYVNNGKVISGPTKMRPSDVTKKAPQGYHVTGNQDVPLDGQSHNVNVEGNLIQGTFTVKLIYNKQDRFGIVSTVDQGADPQGFHYDPNDVKTISVSGRVGNSDYVIDPYGYSRDCYRNDFSDRDVKISFTPDMATTDDVANYNFGDVTYTYFARSANMLVTYVDVNPGAQPVSDVKDSATGQSYSDDDNQVVHFEGHTYPIVGVQHLYDVGLVGQTVNLTAEGADTGTANLVAPFGFQLNHTGNNDAGNRRLLIRLRRPMMKLAMFFTPRRSTNALKQSASSATQSHSTAAKPASSSTSAKASSASSVVDHQSALVVGSSSVSHNTSSEAQNSVAPASASNGPSFSDVSSVSNAPEQRSSHPVSRHTRDTKTEFVPQSINVAKPLWLYNGKAFTKQSRSIFMKPGKQPMLATDMNVWHGQIVLTVHYHDHRYFITGKRGYTRPTYIQKNEVKRHHFIRLRQSAREYSTPVLIKQNYVRRLRKGRILKVNRLINLKRSRKARLQLQNGNWITANRNFVKLIESI